MAAGPSHHPFSSVGQGESPTAPSAAGAQGEVSREEGTGLETEGPYPRRCSSNRMRWSQLSVRDVQNHLDHLVARVRSRHARRRSRSHPAGAGTAALRQPPFSVLSHSLVDEPRIGCLTRPRDETQRELGLRTRRIGQVRPDAAAARAGRCPSGALTIDDRSRVEMRRSHPASWEVGRPSGRAHPSGCASRGGSGRRTACHNALRTSGNRILLTLERLGCKGAGARSEVNLDAEVHRTLRRTHP